MANVLKDIQNNLLIKLKLQKMDILCIKEEVQIKVDFFLKNMKKSLIIVG